MKILKGSLLLLPLYLLFQACAPAPGGTEADITAIRQLVGEEFKAAWDANDPATLSAYFAENADLTLPVSGWIKGREAIREVFTWDKPEGMTGQFDIQDIRFLESDLALVNVEAHFAGGKFPDGNDIPDYWDSATALLKKENGKWQYVALRVMPARGDQDEIRSAVEQAWEEYITAVEAGDYERIMVTFAPDVVVLAPNAPELGYDDMDMHYRGIFDTMRVDVHGNELLEFEVMGNRAIHRGIYRESLIPHEGEPMDFTFNYYVIWERQPDESWKIKRLISNTRGASEDSDVSS